MLAPIACALLTLDFVIGQERFSTIAWEKASSARMRFASIWSSGAGVNPDRMRIAYTQLDVLLAFGHQLMVASINIDRICIVNTQSLR